MSSGFPSHLRPARRAKRRGIALVLVLFALVLAVVLVLGLLTHTRSGRIVAMNYADDAKTRVLADSALNLVLGQIMNATSDSSGNISWASQPGAIRTYNNSGSISGTQPSTTDNFQAGYKLYSAPVMTETGSGSENDFATSDAGAMSQWQTDVGLYVNLNQPVNKNGVLNYPIADPNANGNGAGASLTTPNLVTSNSGVQGFSVDPNTTVPEATTTLAMPVQWLYVLRDGTFAPGAWVGDGSVKIGNAANPNSVPSKNNPIVGRVAFWTDDESSKVNINTASEGLYWDTPKVNTTKIGTSTAVGANVYSLYQAASMASPWLFTANDSWIGTATDQGLAYMQPGRNEFNHFPGHPASTSLSAVFSEFAGTPQDIFDLVPRLADKSTNPPTLLGSAMGTISLIGDLDNHHNTTVDTKLNGDRLYASNGEVLLQSSPSTGTPAARPLNTGLSEQMVDQRKFFLTANSNAPELNLFGRPRIAMWPVSAATDAQHRTAYDNLIAFCSTIRNSSGGTTWPFYFQRGVGGAYDQTSDFGIAGNTALYAYLQSVTGAAAPGFGSSLESKYGSGEIDQIISEMLDYVRCTNIFDTTLEPTSWYAGLTFAGEYTNAIGDAEIWGTEGFPGHAQVLPMLTPDGMGLGRTPTVNEVAIAFICTADGGDGVTINPSQGKALPQNGGYLDSNWTQASINAYNSTVPPNPPLNPATQFPNITLGAGTPTSPSALTANQRRIQAILIVSLATPTEGFPAMCPNIQVQITGTSFFTLNKVQMFPPNQVFHNLVGGIGSMYNFTGGAPVPGVSFPTGFNWNWTGGEGYFGVWSSGYMGFMPILAFAKSPYLQTANGLMQGDQATNAPILFGSVPLNTYPFISVPITVTLPAGTGDALTAGGSAPDGSPITMTFVGGNLQLQLSYPDDYNQGSLDKHGTASVPYQTINNIDFFSTGISIPVPALGGSANHVNNADARPWAWNYDGYGGPAHTTIKNPDGSTGKLYGGRLCVTYAGDTPAVQSFIEPTVDVVRSTHIVDGDFRINAGMPAVNGLARFAQVVDSGGGNAVHTLVQPYYQQNNNINLYLVSQAFPQRDAGFTPFFTNSSLNFNSYSIPAVPSSLSGNSAPYGPSSTGDIDNGSAGQADGPFSNFPDGGNFYGQDNNPPYFYWPNIELQEASIVYSPNRQIPSSGMFGSLPTGVKRGRPWRTLHFRPATSTTPDYQVSAPDHLFMDLFWMPVVQPYAISDTFSTSGKINMNYQILPFTYIKRQTGMYAVLKAERMLTIRNDQAQVYKDDLNKDGQGHGVGLVEPSAANSTGTLQYRPQINIPATLAQFDNRFNSGQIFRSATEICDQYLVPDDGTMSDSAVDPTAVSSFTANLTNTMQSYWGEGTQNHELTGDNSREKPYAVIYPRITTQSNTFRVHYWVETVQKNAANADPTLFMDPDGTYNGPKDVVRAEKRGDYVIERYLPSDDPRYGPEPYNPMTDSLNGMYKIRVLSEAEFGP